MIGAMTRTTFQQAENPIQRFVYLLWHGDDTHEGSPGSRLLGVYSSREAALDRIGRSISLPGFVDHPDNFWVARYTIDRDEWTAGYVEVE
jgi:hypothetical protein